MKPRIRAGVHIARFAGATVFATALLTSCGTENNENPLAEHTTAARPTGDCPAAPTVAELDALVGKAIDPDTPVEDLIPLVHGLEDVDPLPLAEALGNARADTAELDVAWKIERVVDNCGTASAEGNLTVGGQQPIPMAVPIIYHNGTWKVEKGVVCTLIAQTSTQVSTDVSVEEQNRATELMGC